MSRLPKAEPETVLRIFSSESKSANEPARGYDHSDLQPSVEFHYRIYYF